jgi:hypothetical protein
VSALLFPALPDLAKEGYEIAMDKRKIFDDSIMLSSCPAITHIELR